MAEAPFSQLDCDENFDVPAYENSIRDKLAQRLEVLEPGLQLIVVEYPLPNPVGTKGFIDILARDSFGNRVIIELKRSNQSAREALHQVFKYSALFRSKEGLTYGQVRSFVVSTEWDELRIPFAEFSRVAECQCEGFELSIDDKGNVLNAIKHEPAKIAEPLSISRNHSIFLFREPTDRDNAVETITGAFRSIGGEGCFALLMDYKGVNRNVIYRHAVYFVTAAIREDVLRELEDVVREEYGYSDEETEELRDSVEDRFDARLVESVSPIGDDLEIGYPEKFDTLLGRGWTIEGLVRCGKVPMVTAADDDEVVRLIAGTAGQNAARFCKLTSPKFSIQWKEVRERGHYCLLGNLPWTRGFELFCDLIDSDHSTANVSFAIYNPMNLPMAFFQALARGDVNYFPSFEIIAFDPARPSLSGLLGRIEWNGETRPASLRDVFTPDICDLESFFMLQAMNEHWHIDSELMRRHGLYYALARADEDSGGFEAWPVVVSDEASSFIRRTTEEKGHTIDDFIAANPDYLREFIHWMEAHQLEV